MLDDKFSAASFASCGIDSEEARLLADRLAEEVLKELHKVIEERFTDIVRRLNQMGHQLMPEVVALGELTYRDDYNDEQGYHCKLRVAFDGIVSTGYAHLVASDTKKGEKGPPVSPSDGGAYQ
jgi:hypothetical protein